MLSDQLIKEYQSLYLNHYGDEIDANKALQEGLCLVRLLEDVYLKNENEYEKTRK